MKLLHAHGARVAVVSLALAAGACTASHHGVSPAVPRTATIVAINDLYRIEGVDGGAAGGLARVRALRAELEREAPDLLLLHAGDLLFPSLQSRLYAGAQMIDVLNLLDGAPGAFDERMFVTFGNHEFDEDAPEDAQGLSARIAESEFRWLGSNLRFTRGADGEATVGGPHLVRSALVESGGVRIGLFSLTTDLKQPAYVETFADPEEVARVETARLRREGAEVVVALTHLSLDEDLGLLEVLGEEGPDLVIGGHEHEHHAEEVDGRWVLKADADGRSANVVRLTLAPGARPAMAWERRELAAAAPRDPQVAARVASWRERLERDHCQRLAREPGCLADVVGHTAVELAGEELEIRRYETNLGNWIADRARLAFADRGAQVAFVNAGGLRLNHDLPPGEITRENVEEIFQYPSELVLLKISGRVLAEVVEHAASPWTGEGKWLQISGFAYRHDPRAETASDLTLLAPEGARPVDPDEEILAVTVDFLADPGTGQDGYTMLTREMWVAGEDAVAPLRQQVFDGLAAAGEAGIAPAVEGRICTSERPALCLIPDPAS